MSELSEETQSAIKEFSELKDKFPRIATVDIIKLLERIQPKILLLESEVDEARDTATLRADKICKLETEITELRKRDGVIIIKSE